MIIKNSVISIRKLVYLELNSFCSGVNGGLEVTVLKETPKIGKKKRKEANDSPLLVGNGPKAKAKSAANGQGTKSAEQNQQQQQQKQQKHKQRQQKKQEQKQRQQQENQQHQQERQQLQDIQLPQQPKEEQEQQPQHEEQHRKKSITPVRIRWGKHITGYKLGMHQIPIPPFFIRSVPGASLFPNININVPSFLLVTSGPSLLPTVCHIKCIQ